jgi:hypothetical protein
MHQTVDAPFELGGGCTTNRGGGCTTNWGGGCMTNWGGGMYHQLRWPPNLWRKCSNGDALQVEGTIPGMPRSDALSSRAEARRLSLRIQRHKNSPVSMVDLVTTETLSDQPFCFLLCN